MKMSPLFTQIINSISRLCQASALEFIQISNILMIICMIFSIAMIHASIEGDVIEGKVVDSSSENESQNMEDPNPIIVSLASKLPFVTFALLIAILLTSIYQLYNTFKGADKADEEFYQKVNEEMQKERQLWENSLHEKKENLRRKLDENIKQLGEMLKKTDLATTEANQSLAGLANQASAAAAAAAAASKQQRQLAAPLRSGETEHYAWTQTADEVEVCLPVPPGTQCCDIKHELTPNSIFLSAQGHKLIEGKLFATVIPEESTWVLDKDGNGKRIVWSLQKTEPTKNRQWQYVVKGEVKGTLKSSFGDVYVEELEIDDYESITKAIKALRK